MFNLSVHCSVRMRCAEWNQLFRSEHRLLYCIHATRNASYILGVDVMADGKQIVRKTGHKVNFKHSIIHQCLLNKALVACGMII